MSQDELTKLDKMLHAIVERHTKNKKGVSSNMIVVGDRPSGKISADHILLDIIKNSAIDAGLEVSPINSVASTDANIPLSRNIPAVAIGCYSGFGAHTKSETVLIKSLEKGVPFSNLAIIRVIEAISNSLI